MAAGVLVVLAGPAASPAVAQDSLMLRGVFGGGMFSVLDDDDAAAMGRGELRFENVVAQAPWLVPMVGIEVTSDGAFYGYGGLLFDIALTDAIYLAPNAAVGYFEEGDGRDLGHELEFRTGLELGYLFPGGTGVGVAFHHISNAGLGDENPGVETLTVNVSVPFN